LRLLRSDGMIDMKTSKSIRSGFTLITVTNYEKFQSGENADIQGDIQGDIQTSGLNSENYETFENSILSESTSNGTSKGTSKAHPGRIQGAQSENVKNEKNEKNKKEDIAEILSSKDQSRENMRRLSECVAKLSDKMATV